MNRRNKAFIGIIIAWICCILIIVGILIIKKQRVKGKEITRESIVEDMFGVISDSSQSSFVVDVDDMVVEGEEQDFPDPVLPEPSESLEDSQTDSEPESNSGSGLSYNLITCGTLSIPSIDCELPIWEGAGKVELRYGVGHIPITAGAGQNGNFAILGHRMKKYGSLFNRLGEVQLGDSIIVSAGDCTYTYIVDEIVTISPSELSAYIGVAEEGCRITLVTCTPTGVGSHRLLVIGHLA